MSPVRRWTISTLTIEDLIAELEAEFTIVIVTHNMQQAARLSDQNGLLQCQEPPTGRAVWSRVDDAKIFSAASGYRDYISRPVR